MCVQRAEYTHIRPARVPSGMVATSEPPRRGGTRRYDAKSLAEVRRPRRGRAPRWTRRPTPVVLCCTVCMYSMLSGSASGAAWAVCSGCHWALCWSRLEPHASGSQAASQRRQGWRAVARPSRLGCSMSTCGPMRARRWAAVRGTDARRGARRRRLTPVRRRQGGWFKAVVCS